MMPNWMAEVIAIGIGVSFAVILTIGGIQTAIASHARNQRAAARKARAATTDDNPEAERLRKAARKARKRAASLWDEGSVTDAQNLEWEADAFDAEAARLELDALPPA